MRTLVEATARDELPSLASRSRSTKAARDFVDGLTKSWLWMSLAMQDIKLRYRGSLLGPFWITLGTTVTVAAMGILYARMFHMDVSSYLPFLTSGLVLWQFVSTLITESCSSFVAMSGIIHQIQLPYSVHVYRVVWRNLLVLAHNLIVIPPVLFLCGAHVDWHVAVIFPAIVLLALNGVWCGILLGMISARYRDVPPIVTSFLQVIFFVTPIFWSPDLIGAWGPFVELNPWFAAIDVVMAPLVGKPVAPFSWYILLVTTVIGSGCTFLFFARFRSRIAFWV